jgi:hypothetical protein
MTFFFVTNSPGRSRFVNLAGVTRPGIRITRITVAGRTRLFAVGITRRADIVWSAQEME